MKGRKKSSGGRTNMKVSGNPNVFKEAAERKKGGRVPAGKTIGLMTGGAVRPRLDRPGRKSGGRVGSNTAPLSTAHGTVSAEKTPGNNADSN